MLHRYLWRRLLPSRSVGGDGYAVCQQTPEIGPYPGGQAPGCRNRRSRAPNLRERYRGHRFCCVIPTHGSWLNLIESFFGKMAKTPLRGLRVTSKAELKTRIEMYLREVNEEPVVFRWKYKLETLSVV
jgi:hypothetical protein